MSKARQLCEDIMFAKDFLNFAYLGGNKHSIDIAENFLITKKKAWRQYLKDQNDQYRIYKNSHIVASGGDYDSCWCKVFFPGEEWTEQDALEFIEENWRYKIYSPYDCTGCYYTYLINVFSVPSGIICYIKEGRDV